jgi:hypothetical protein
MEEHISALLNSELSGPSQLPTCPMVGQAPFRNYLSSTRIQQTDPLDNPVSANALLSTQDFFDLSAAASPMDPMQQHANGGFIGANDFLLFDALGQTSAI